MLYITHKQTLTYSFSSQKSINKNKKMFFTNIFFLTFFHSKKNLILFFTTFYAESSSQIFFSFFLLFSHFFILSKFVLFIIRTLSHIFPQNYPYYFSQKRIFTLSPFLTKIQPPQKNVLFTHEQKQ